MVCICWFTLTFKLVRTLMNRLLFKILYLYLSVYFSGWKPCFISFVWASLELCGTGSKQNIQNENRCIKRDSKPQSLTSAAGASDHSVTLTDDDICMTGISSTVLLKLTSTNINQTRPQSYVYSIELISKTGYWLGVCHCLFNLHWQTRAVNIFI